ncbi:MAG: ferritin-like domain-containing protein [Candidatus Bathyarchaeota archaeon]|nr:ferritin-like domain-containing protein [Candidatus Bathyarchaeota archaeon]MDH5532038.1 ferritin-like domain-containing protein [Candidatus Bathyarchaeota archaeon]MDH5712735.1 ferritin-like domain-containing protein [Candidatus Bathyarchaeota archaeon]
MSKTEENLKFAFAGESQARNKYAFFAEVARAEGFEQIAAIFEETAANEKAHAERLFEFLKGVGDTKQNLKTAIEGEHYEWTQMYPTFEREAREEGLTEIADVLKEIAEVEEQHEKRYGKLLKNLEEGKVFKKEKVVKWKCRNCGYVHEGKEPPESCPVCGYSQGFYELLCENY